MERKFQFAMNITLIASTLITFLVARLSMNKISLSFLISLSIGIIINLSLLSDFSFDKHNKFSLSLGDSVTNFNIWLALLFPPILILFEKISNKKMIDFSILVLFISTILTVLLFFGGRSGFVMSICAIFFLYLAKIRISTLILGVSFGFLLIGMSELFLLHLRLDRLGSVVWTNPDSVYTALNWFSAGRLDHYNFGIQRFLECPIIGCGLGESTYNGFEIHNVFLRVLAEGGILLFFMLFTPIVLFWNNASNKKVKIILLIGLVGGCFESNVIFGNFGISIPFWIIASYALQRPRALEGNNG